jgi:hypothetical protein
MAEYLATFHPLCGTGFGRARLRERAHLRPFVDASCRREPDLEHEHPAITALCRGRAFAPRLRAGDRVAYLTVKGQYAGSAARCWGLVAALEVVHVLPSHAAGADWYQRHGLPLPSNCLRGTEPKPLEDTAGLPPQFTSLRKWDASYHVRVRKWPSFLVTRPIVVELEAPAAVTHDDLVAIFGRVPGTRTPPRITAEEFGSLTQLGVDAPNGRLGVAVGRL